jgi:hypothetical protein
LLRRGQRPANAGITAQSPSRQGTSSPRAAAVTRPRSG